MSPTSPLISDNVTSIELSVIKEMAMLGAQVPGAVSLAWGLPSFRTPAHIRAAVNAALEEDADVGKYTLPDGLPELRSVVAHCHTAATGIPVDPDDHVIVTAGNMQGMNMLFHVLLNAGDEVIVTDPGFASHFQQIRLCGGRVRYWPLDEARGWQLDLDALPALITPRTRAIVLVTPSNPTGRIFERDDLLEVGRLAREHGMMVLIDDPYSRFVYENRGLYFNLASDVTLRENLVYLFTFSKAYAMSGWRLGYMIVPAELKRQALKVHDATIICAPHIAQVAGMTALRSERPPWIEFEQVLRRRRSLICERLDAVPHVFDYVRPQGAYYVFPRITAPHSDSREFSMRLLREAGVTVTPGRGFGPGGEHHVRIAYCVSEDAINLGFDRIETYFNKGRGNKSFGNE